MMSLFIQENVIEDMSEGLENMQKLRTLNLNDNCIKTISGLKNCEVLDTVYFKRNRIGCGKGAVDDLKGLLECPSIASLDISDNQVDDPAVIDEIFCKMPELLVLYA